ncbi:hypothetical protein T492DRAFT_850710 [Pavlovales sp. CCMP2436]|nr:hypothetical protein T492DRAFT_850710 [Pavlovales sp. CCMP2436]
MQFGRFLGRVARFGSRAIPAIQKFGRQGGTFLNTAAEVASRVAKTAWSGLSALENSELGCIPGAGELIGLSRNATNALDVAAHIAGRAGNFAAGVALVQRISMEAYRYESRPIASPAEMIRHYLTSTGGGAPVSGSAKSEFQVPCGTPGLRLDSSQSILSFSVNNNNSTPMTLNCGAQACIASLELYFGSQHLSSIQEYGALFSLVQDFTTDLDSLRSSGTVRGIADFSPAGVASADKITNAFRLGSMVIPQSPIACTGSAAEAQFKLACTFGGGISDAAAHSCVSAAQYLTDGLKDAARFLAAGGVYRDSTGLYAAATASLRAAVASATAAATAFSLGTATVRSLEPAAIKYDVSPSLTSSFLTEARDSCLIKN